MRTLARLGTLPVAVTVLTGITAAYYLLVVWGNVEAYDVNHSFVENVFAMNTLFQDEHQLWRAISNDVLVHIAYVLIIIWEALITLVLVAAFVSWLRALAAGPAAGPARFDLARQLSTLGWTMVILLFAGGFVTIGGEWFLMWQSDYGGALQTAVNNFLIAAVGIILVHLVRTGNSSAVPAPRSAPASESAEPGEPAAEPSEPAAEPSKPAAGS